MAIPSTKLITAIRSAAKRLNKSPEYQWGHMGSCNCGFLAQEITNLSKTEIHRRAMLGRGDWNDQLSDYCPTSGLLMDDLISDLLGYGLAIEDLQYLERLSDPEVIEKLPGEKRSLKHNMKKDVVEYMITWASILEEKLLDQIELPKFQIQHTYSNQLENSKL